MNTPKYLCATMAILALAGCGHNDDEGGGSASSSPQQPAFTGAGTEIDGYFSFKVTANTGFLQSKYYAPVGWTGFIYIDPNNDGTVNVQRYDVGYGGWRTITLSPDTATNSYKGVVTYVNSVAGGTYVGEDFDEEWTLNFNGAIANLVVTVGVDDDNSNVTPPIASGTMTLDLQAPWTFNDSYSTYFYGRQTAFSGDARYVGQTGITELYDWGPGTYGYFYIDGAYNWNDYIYLEGLWKEGNTLTGGGFYDGSYGNNFNAFGTVSIALSTAERPTSATALVWDPSDDSVTSISHTGYLNDNQFEGYLNNTGIWHDLTVTTVTTGGELENLFGPAGTTNTDEFYYGGGDWISANSLSGFYLNISGNTAGAVCWDGNYYDYYAISSPTSEPSYQLDGDSTTQDRLSYSLTFNDDGFFTSGTVVYETYSRPADLLLSTETMTFTLNAAPVISSTLTASGTINVAMTTYNITATHGVDSYSATGLPAGVTVDTNSGAITGTPTVSGTFNVIIGATNAAGTGTATLVMTIAP